MSDSVDDGDDRILAGEYVLGVLDAGEMSAVRARARTEPAFRAEISWWESSLSPLATTVAPRTPPAGLWDRLAAAIAAVPLAANENAPVAKRRVWPWQLSTAASLALAAGLAAFVYLQPPATTVVRVAALTPIGVQPAAFVAEAASDGRVTLASLSPATVPAGQSLQLWVLPPGATKVASVGLLPPGGETFDLGPPPATGTQYLVSLEQAGGSPTGQPQGKVLYGGTFAGVGGPPTH